MTNAEDVHRIVLQHEQNSVVAEAQPERTSHVAAKRHDPPATRARKMENALKDAHGGDFIQRANVSPGFIEPLNLIRRHLLAVF